MYVFISSRMESRSRKIFIEYCNTPQCLQSFEEISSSIQNEFGSSVECVGNVKPPRLNALEIQDDTGHLLFSKLATGELPDVSKVSARVKQLLEESPSASSSSPSSEMMA
mmetsp:Transcript_30669/g.49635  ORF Transcript_30669/g.49635 Transcript_30669/m.49635 type:complete len:110 (-) Transcript_30669:351-680(-)